MPAKKPIEYHVNENGCHICTSHARNKKGYPSMCHNGKTCRINRYTYEQHYGKIPEGMIVRHTCNNPSCINISHLELGTARDNQRDKVIRGRSCRGSLNAAAKLTEEQVKEIYLAENFTQMQLAEKYGVERSVIGRIRQGVSWKHITKDLCAPKKITRRARIGKLSCEQVREIYISDKTYKELADEFGITKRVVSTIKSGDRYTRFTTDLKARYENTYFSKTSLSY